MPIDLKLPLDVESPPTIAPVNLPDLFLQCIAAADADLAGRLRAAPPPRPYTLSNFFVQGGRWIWRVVLLRDDLLAPLCDGLQHIQRLPPDSAGISVNFGPPEVLQVSYETLSEQAEEATILRLRFLSPTSTRTGLVAYPLPDPMVLFQSWWTRWNVFAPVKVARVLLDVAAVHVAVAYCRIHTRSFNLGVGRQTGFVGRLTLRIVQAHRLGADMLRALNTLAAYAAFCGTGQRTAQGMGQTLFLREPMEK